MKKSLFYYLFVVLCAVNLFSSCSENESIVLPIDSDLAGKYKGKLDVSISQGGVDIPGGTVNSQIITVTKAGDNAVSLSITDFSFMGIEIGDINLNDCVLTTNGDNYEFTGTTKVEAELLTADVDATGVFSNGSLNLNLDIDATLTGGVKQAVKVTYSGTRLKGDESSEAKITSFIFDREVAEVDSLVIGETTINEEAKTITFMVADTAKAEYLTALVPTIEVSKGATVVPASGEAQDFSNGKIVTYTVTAEDGTVAEYKVSIASKVMSLTFENWVYDDTYHYYTPAGFYASTNGGSAVVYSSLEGIASQHPEVVVPPYCVTQETEDVKEGATAACLQTVSLIQAKQDLKEYGGLIGGIMANMAPNITAGSLFMGSFELNAAAPLKSTKFGVMHEGKPLKFSGWYKYTPGETFYDKDANIVEGKVDECDIYAVLYEVEDESFVLDGESIKQADAPIVMRAGIESGNATDWKRFDLDFKEVNGKSYDPNKMYKIAFICTSSKNGDVYEGAPESKLLLDDLQITFE